MNIYVCGLMGLQNHIADLWKRILANTCGYHVSEIYGTIMVALASLPLKKLYEEA